MHMKKFLSFALLVMFIVVCDSPNVYNEVRSTY